MPDGQRVAARIRAVREKTAACFEVQLHIACAYAFGWYICAAYGIGIRAAFVIPLFAAIASRERRELCDMSRTGLWDYCTKTQYQEMLLSFQLLENKDWTEKKKIACLYALARHPEGHYKRLEISKKNGGTRVLYAPDFLLKDVQSQILHHILMGFWPSSYVFSYRKGVSVLDHGKMHSQKPMVLQLDIADFFGSISFSTVLNCAFSARYFPEPVGVLLASLCCLRGCLPQGAPTSPAISNLVMRPFDIYMADWCRERGIAYSRYCDDMAFSGAFDSKEVTYKVKGFLGAMGMELNREKTRLSTRGGRQMVTGLVVNEKPGLPTEARRKLRQEVYYCLKYGARDCLARKKLLAKEDKPYENPRAYLEALMGRVSWLLYINPKDSWFEKARGDLRRQWNDGDGI